jgi:hypothetical protein
MYDRPYPTTAAAPAGPVLPVAVSCAAMRRARLLASLLLAACDAPADAPATQAAAPTVRMDFTRADGFFTAPFPSHELVRADGTVDLARWPNAAHQRYVQGLMDLAGATRGFGTSSTIYLPLTDEPDPAQLPGPAGSVAPGGAVFVFDLQRSERVPVTVRWMPDGGPYGGDGLLTLVPVQGIPLRANTAYAAVVLRTLRLARGGTFATAPAVLTLAAGGDAGLSPAAAGAYRSALQGLQRALVFPADIAGLAVFTTGDPVGELRAFLDDARARPLPAPAGPLLRTDVFPGYCVYQATVRLPSYQQGALPFGTTGGDWSLTADGHPRFSRDEESRVVVTIPRRRATAPGPLPAVLFVRTGGGGDRPMVDRGVRSVPGVSPEQPGTGPAMEFARVGWAGVSWDGPHGGPRNVSMGDEQFLMFNVANPTALRDNVRQSALEAARMYDVARALRLDVSDCPGAVAADGSTAVQVDPSVIMGHSMGATIAPLALAVEPRFRAAILSGAGGSYIANVIHKLRPLAVAPLARVLVGYGGIGRDFREDDPALALMQWALESSDPQVYGRHVIDEPLVGDPRSVFVIQGITDHYILPPIANAVTLSMGLDLGGEALDQSNAELRAFTSLVDLLPLRSAAVRPFPIAGNRRGVTAVVAQLPGDALEDGHEAAFQTAEPKRLYRCFLASVAAGRPALVGPGTTCGD